MGGVKRNENSCNYILIKKLQNEATKMANSKKNKLYVYLMPFIIFIKSFLKLFSSASSEVRCSGLAVIERLGYGGTTLFLMLLSVFLHCIYQSLHLIGGGVACVSKGC